MNLQTIKKAIFQILEVKPLWLNHIEDERTLFLIAVSNGMAKEVQIELSNTEDLVHYYKTFQNAQILHYKSV